MSQTFDFIILARNNKKFMELLQNALSSDKDSVLFTDRHKLFFDAQSQTLYIVPQPDCVKVIPTKITYRATRKLLNAELDGIMDADVEIMHDDIDKNPSFRSFLERFNRAQQ